MISNLRLKLRSANEELQSNTRRLKTQAPANEVKKPSTDLNKKGLKQNDNRQGTKIKIISNQVKQILKQNNNEAKYYQQIALKRTENCKKYAKKQSSFTNATKFRTESNHHERFSFEKSKLINKIFKEEDHRKITLQPKRPETKELKGEQRYTFENKVGCGTFGVVHKARDKQTLELVAIKKVYQDKKYKNRQLQILKLLNHPNVAKIKDSFFTYESQKQYLNVVMDYYPLNLSEFITKYQLSNEISELHIKLLAYQLLNGLLYLQFLNIAHRDMKPHNVLVNDKKFQLIVCDFGSAKKLQPLDANLAYICSRSYRAPQLIFGCTKYNCQIDMWSAGCILVEMVIHQPLFRANSNIDQLVQIIKVLGTPTVDEIKQMNPDCQLDKYKFPKITGVSWEKIFSKSKIGPDFLSLVKGILRYSPQKRLNAFESLKHPYFNELRQKETYQKLKGKLKFADLFDYSWSIGYGKYNISELIPKWYVS